MRAGLLREYKGFHYSVLLKDFIFRYLFIYFPKAEFVIFPLVIGTVPFAFWNGPNLRYLSTYALCVYVCLWIHPYSFIDPPIWVRLPRFGSVNSADMS